MTLVGRHPQFDYYELSRILGEGGMGVVYLARDRRTDLSVAIKVMSKRLHDPDLQFRFMRENEIISSLKHRNIVGCYEVTRSKEGTPSIVMEYIDGVDLRSFEGRPYPELLPLMIQTLLGMGYLKSQSIVHRDLSSNNVMVCIEKGKRLVKIVDFGIAKILSHVPTDGGGHTQTGQFLGKFAFASPELFFSTEIDWRSDLYSLGVIFYRLLTAEPPLKIARPSNFFEWVTAHQADHTPSFEIPHGCPPLPDPLRDALGRMLARRPEDRPESYEELIELFDRLQSGARSVGLDPDPVTLTQLPPAPPQPTPPSHPSDSGAASPLRPLGASPVPSATTPDGSVRAGIAGAVVLPTPVPAASGSRPAPQTPPPAGGASRTPHPDTPADQRARRATRTPTSHAGGPVARAGGQGPVVGWVPQAPGVPERTPRPSGPARPLAPGDAAAAPPRKDSTKSVQVLVWVFFAALVLVAVFVGVILLLRQASQEQTSSISRSRPAAAVTLAGGGPAQRMERTELTS